ncbi:MAG: sorbosone dehydrogenase family protein [Pirellulales bacterium]
MLKNISRGILGALLLLASQQATHAAIAGLQRVATGLNNPVFATHAPGDRDRMFVLEKGGAIKIVNLQNNTVSGTFMSIGDTDSAGEGGLIGMAFHPNYFKQGETGFGKFYVYVTVDNGGTPIDGVNSAFTSRIREYSVTADPNVADPATKNEVLSWLHPLDNHNGGWIGFNPEVNPGDPQYLYINSGDGGKQGDPDNNAQTITNERLGKILRIDVNSDDFSEDDTRDYAIPPSNPFVGTTGDDEIYAYGVRNPWRGSIDRLTGDYWVGDVGNGAREEIDMIPYGKTGSNNLGWRRFEGNNDSQPAQPIPADYIPPVYDYLRTTPAGFEGRAVNGGYVYRGPDPSLQGLYFFSDSQVKNTWTIDPLAANPPSTVDNIDTELGTLYANNVGTMVSFGEDAVGNLYIVDYAGGTSGEIYRIVTNEVIAGDYNADGLVDDADYAVWNANYGATAGAGLAADGNHDNVVDAADFTVWQDNFGNSVHATGAGSVAVPEPATSVLAVLLAAVSGVFLRLRPRRPCF